MKEIKKKFCLIKKMSLIGNQSLNKATSNFTAIYIGIATYDDESIDQLIYSSEGVMTHFARGIRQCSWFSKLMVNMKQTGTSPYTYETLKAADFLLSTWMRIKFPEVVLKDALVPKASFPEAYYGPATRDADGKQVWNPATDGLVGNTLPVGRAFQVAWSPNPGHNIVRESKLYVNDVPIETLDHTWMDLITQFRTTQGKIEQYQSMIGNVPAAIDWTTGGFFGSLAGQANKCDPRIPAFEVNVPQSFFYDRDSSTSFPLCAVTLNKVEIRTELRNALDLLRYRIETYIPTTPSLQQDGAVIRGQYVFLEVPVKQVSANQKSLVNINEFLKEPNNVTIAGGQNGNNDIPQMWSMYAVVTKRERNAHSARGCKRDLLIEYVQKSDNSTDNNIFSSNTGNSASDSQFKYEFIFNNPIRCLMYVAENVTAQENYHIWSNYSNNIETPGAGRDSIKEISFRVDNTIDMYQNVPTVFFTHVDPFYVAERIPNKVGYHALFYCLDINSLEADGSWNYNKVKGYASYTYNEPEGYLATGILVDKCKQMTYGFDLNTATFSLTGTSSTVTGAYSGYPVDKKDITMRLRIRGLAWNVIRLQDNVLGFPLG